MKILLISLFLPRQKSSHAGGRYVFEIIKELSIRHEVHLATRVDEQEQGGLEDLRPFCRKVHPYTYMTSAKRGLLATVRLIINYLGFSWQANRIISSDRYDIVQVEWVETGVMIKRGAIPMVLDAHDVITKPAERRYHGSRGIRRVLRYAIYRFVKRVETSIARRFDRVVTLSPFDAEYLRSMDPSLRIETIPIPAGLDMTERTFERENDTILFLASYKYRRTNVEAALFFYTSILPLVREEIPRAKFIIAGYGPPEEILSLPSKDPDIVVTGFLDDTEAYYKKAAVFIAPTLVGGGIIVKVLDAMAAGTPVVTTTYGNEGIGAEPGQDLLVADDPRDFARTVVRLLKDREFAEQIGRNGKAFIQRHFGRESIFRKLNAVYRDLSPSTERP